MRKNINDYKFIVSTGCSYGITTKSLCHEIPFKSTLYDIERPPKHEELRNLPFDDRYEILEGNIVLISGALSSQGSKWQADSTSYIITKLLNLGVNPENIYCFIEWSEFFRTTTISNSSALNKEDFDKIKLKYYQHEQYIKVIDKDNKQVLDYGEEIFQLLKDNIKIGIIDSNVVVGVIGDEYYITPSQVAWKDNWNIKVKEEWSEKVNPSYKDIPDKIEDKLKIWAGHWTSLESQISLEMCVHDYMDNILRTQYFLKSKNIKYDFTFINQQLSGFRVDDEGSVIFNNRHHYLVETRPPFDFIKKEEFSDPENDIENVYYQIKDKFKELDLSNIYFHNSDRFRRGGIDEIIFDEVGMYGHIRIHDIDIWNQRELPRWDRSQVDLPYYCGHPNIMYYVFVWDKVATNCTFLKLKQSYLDYIKNCSKKDYESEDKNTIYGLTLSKKTINKIWTEIINLK